MSGHIFKNLKIPWWHKCGIKQFSSSSTYASPLLSISSLLSILMVLTSNVVVATFDNISHICIHIPHTVNQPQILCWDSIVLCLQSILSPPLKKKNFKHARLCHFAMCVEKTCLFFKICMVLGKVTAGLLLNWLCFKTTTIFLLELQS